MDLVCIICSDSFVSSSEVYITSCGHMFHYACLIQWLERSKSCPQCRAKAVHEDLRKVYFSTGNCANRADADDDDDDRVILKSELENAKFEITLKTKDVEFYREQHEKVKYLGLYRREKLKKLFKDIVDKNSVIRDLKSQIIFFKSKSKEKDRLAEELTKAKNRIKELERVELVIEGSREEVNEMLKNVDDVGCLVTLSATLKKALVYAEKEKKLTEDKLKAQEIEIAKYRKHNLDLSCENRDLRKDIEMLRTKYDDLRKISSPDVEKKTRVESYQQIISDKTPSVAKKIHDNVAKGDSPYLLVKQTSSFFAPSSNQMYKRLSIFRKRLNSSYKCDGFLNNGLMLKRNPDNPDEEESSKVLSALNSGNISGSTQPGAASSILTQADQVALENYKDTSPPKVPKLVISSRRLVESDTKCTPRSQRTSEKLKKHKHKKKRRKFVNSLDDESENDYSDPDYLP